MKSFTKFTLQQAQELHRESTHEAMYPILLTAQILGLIPVTGINAASPMTLKFKWTDPRTIYSFIFGISGVATLLQEIVRVSNIKRIDAKSGAGVFFFSITTIGIFNFIAIAWNWETLITVWSKSEAIFLRKPYFRPPRFSLKLKLCVTAFIVLGFGLIEHLFYRLSQFDLYKREIEYCKYTVDALQFFIEHDFQGYRHVLPLNALTGIFLYVSIFLSFPQTRKKIR